MPEADRATQYQTRSALLALFSPVKTESYKMGTDEGM